MTWFGGRVLVGRRAAWTACDAGLFECAPSGGVEPGMSPEEAVVREFAEEVGGTPRATRAMAVVFDAHARSWEVVFRLEAVDATIAPEEDEYQQLAWCEPSAMPRDRTPLTDRLMSLGLLEYQADRASR